MSGTIDRAARNAAAQTLRDFVAGRITNDAFEAAEPNTEDPAVLAAFDWAWILYDDVRSHRLTGRDRPHPADRREVLRWIVFLDTDLPFVWPGPQRNLYCDTGSLLPWRRKHARHALQRGCYDAYPFASHGDAKRALGRPRRLAETRRPL